MGSHWRFIIHSLIFSILSCHLTIPLSTFIHLAVPLMRLYNHTCGELFGIYDGGALFLSICSWSSTISQLCSLIFIVPLMDWSGRKFVSVYMKSAMSLCTAILMIASWYFQTAIMYVCGLTVGALAATATSIADPTYIAELAPEEHRDDYLATCATTIPIIVSSVLMLVLSRIDVFGTDDSWWIIIVISQVFNAAFFLVGSQMESTKNLRKTSNLTKFFRGHTSKVTDVFRDWKIGKNNLLIVCLPPMLIISSCDIEGFYPMQMYAQEGVATNEVLTMNLITEVLSLPYYWIGPVAVDKLSRKMFLVVVEAVIILKTVIHLANLEVQSLFLAYPNAILSRLLMGCGIGSLQLILANEVLPREYVSVGGQLAVLSSTITSGVTDSVIPFLLLNELPILLISFAIIGFVIFLVVVKLLPKEVDEKNLSLLLICFTTIGLLIFWVLMQLLPNDAADELPEKKKLLP